MTGRLRGRTGRADRSAFAEFALAHHFDAVIGCDTAGHVVVFNEAARELFGAPREGGDPDPWATADSVYDARAERVLRADELPLARALAGERTQDVELYVHAADGTRSAFVVNAGPVVDDHGHTLGAIAGLRDISGTVTPEEELRLQDSMLRHLPVSVAVVRAADGELVYANESWAALLGYAPAELVGQHVSLVTAPTESTPAERAEEIMGALERSGTWHGEVENIRKDGTRLWTTADVARFEHPHHGTVWVSLQRDVSDRHSTERDERADRTRLRSVFEDAPLGMAVVGNDLRMAEANPALCELTGYTREELTGMSFSDLTHPDDHAGDILPAAQLRVGEVSRYRREKRYVTKAGTVVPVVEIVSASRGAGGEHLHDVVMVDTRPV